MVTLYQMQISPFCDKIRGILAYKEIPFRVVNVPVIGKRKGFIDCFRFFISHMLFIFFERKRI